MAKKYTSYITILVYDYVGIIIGYFTMMPSLVTT